MKKNTYLLMYLLLSVSVGISLNGCCGSSNKNLNQNKNVEMLNKQIPPNVNSAEVEAEIISLKDENGYTNSEIKIIEVKSYGASVPPIIVGSIIKAGVSETSIENSKLTKDDLLKSGSKYKVTLEHFIVPPNSKSPSWRIISIE